MCDPSLQTSDGYMCPSAFVAPVLNASVELDPAIVANMTANLAAAKLAAQNKTNTTNTTTTRLLEDGEPSLVRMTDSTQKETVSMVEDVSLDSRRALQLNVIDKTTASSASSNSGSTLDTVQIYFLKLRNSNQDQLTYSQIQSVVIQDSFFSVLGDRLKDFPRVVAKTPLISLQFFPQSIDSTSKIYNRGDNSQIQLTELSIKLEGYLYCMILADPDGAAKKTLREAARTKDNKTDPELLTGYPSALNDDLIMGLHVKYGIYLNNSPAVWKVNYTVDDPNWVLHLNIDDLPLNTSAAESRTYYSFYYYATDKRVEELAASSQVYRIDFEIWKPQTVNRAGLFWLSKALFVVLALFALFC